MRFRLVRRDHRAPRQHLIIGERERELVRAGVPAHGGHHGADTVFGHNCGLCHAHVPHDQLLIKRSACHVAPCGWRATTRQLLSLLLGRTGGKAGSTDMKAP